jgi:hypothetical protein
MNQIRAIKLGLKGRPSLIQIAVRFTFRITEFAGQGFEKSRSPPRLQLRGYPIGWVLMELAWRLGTTSVAANRIPPFAW